MPADRTGEPWPDATYNGFSGPLPPERRSPRWGRMLLIGGAAAIVLGAGFGFLIRPHLASSGGESSGRAPPAALPIQVKAPPPQAQPRSDGKLEVLPPDIAAQARAQAQAAQAAPAPVAPLPEILGAPDATSGPPAPPTPAPAVRPPPMAIAPPPQRQFAGRMDAGCAGGPAEQMICQDPGLAAADRAMARAYRRAIASGADPRALRADQRDFMGIREDAASRSRRALASVMAQRIDELNAIADQGRGGGEEDEGPGF